MTLIERLAAAGPAARIGLGLAAVGRPAYINVGHHADLPPDRSVGALRERAHQLLDDGYARGVRYLDVARSYGWRSPPCCTSHGYTSSCPAPRPLAAPVPAGLDLNRTGVSPPRVAHLGFGLCLFGPSRPHGCPLCRSP